MSAMGRHVVDMEERMAKQTPELRLTCYADGKVSISEETGKMVYYGPRSELLAAPDLLVAAKAMVKAHDALLGLYRVEMSSPVEALRTAIAKAEGE